MSESDRKRNQREQSRLAEEALGLLPHQRQNHPPTPVDELLACPQSKYRTHRFVGRNRDGLTCCEFCGELLQAWQAKKRARR